MDSETIGFMPAVKLAELIRRRKISPVEYLRGLLSRIATLGPKVNAFAYLAADRAMDDAKKAELAVMRGEQVGRLHGVPVTLKDLLMTKDMPTQYGSKIFAGNQPDEDAPVVSRLVAEGAIMLGKTTTSEFGMGSPGISRSPLTGITSNPWKLGYNAGASSGGAAAAAAAGFGPLHQGGDGGGSIRLPAHFCGVFGLKPSFGRVPFYPVSIGGHIGPITRTVADAALMLEAMAGPHFLDHTTLEGKPDNYVNRLREGIRGKRIAYSPNLGVASVDPEVAELAQSAVRRFTELGAVVEEVPTPWAKEGPELFRFFWSAAMTKYAQYLPEWQLDMEPGFVDSIKQSGSIPLSRYNEMRKREMVYVANIHRWFQDWDFLLTPSAPIASGALEKLLPDLAWVDFFYPFNMSWNPAASVPCGFTQDGLPVGLQIVGKRFDDLGVLQASAAFEELQPWAEKRPRL
ncbi:amidase family protein [Bradyrhizobium sp. U531]|uniref:amidase n=1 Tax=Bradyrhizobium sp. U531 TaxID=3053458 RepID=UPI003F443D83